MNLKDISLEINDLLEQRRKDLQLTFVEEKHIYFMKDVDGEIKSNFPSVSKIIKKFHKQHLTSRILRKFRAKFLHKNKKYLE